MIFQQLRMGPMANFVYLFGKGGQVCVVDPAFEVPRILTDVAKLGVNVSDILVTHGHHDHTQGVAALKAQTGARVIAYESADHPIDRGLADGEVLDLADCRVEVVHTPGHRFDSACYIIDGTHLLTGDTLFVGECGRVDLPGSDVRAMHKTLLETLAGLPGELIVCSGHDYGPTPLSTLAHERKTNYVLKPRTLDEFLQFMREP